MKLSENKLPLRITFGAIIAIILLGTIGYSFYKYNIKKDFISYNKEYCDPDLYTCFVAECPDGDPRCQDVAEDGLYTFLLIEKHDQYDRLIYCDDTNLYTYSNFVADSLCSS